MDTPVMDEQGTDLNPERFDIEISHVSFAYGKEDVLHDVSVTILEKTTCAIVGPSGSGKSTVARLIASFWEADNGAVELGGVDVRNIPLSQVMDTVPMSHRTIFCST